MLKNDNGKMFKIFVFKIKSLYFHESTSPPHTHNVPLKIITYTGLASEFVGIVCHDGVHRTKSMCVS